VKQYQNSVSSNPSPGCFPKHSSKPLSHCSHSEQVSSRHSIEKPPPHHTAFLPVEVGEMPPLISCGESLVSYSESLMPRDESLMPRDASRIEIVTQSGLVLRFPGETTLDVLAGLVRQLESALVLPAQSLC
jgi:hypothetical protein